MEELRAKALTGRRANVVRSLQANIRAASYRLDCKDSFAEKDRSFIVRCPSTWSELRQRIARGALTRHVFLKRLGGPVDDDTPRGLHAHSRVLTSEEANRISPVDADLLKSLALNARTSVLTSMLSSRRLAVLAEEVKICYDPDENPAGSIPRACLDDLDVRLKVICGPMSAAPWVNTWTKEIEGSWWGDKCTHHFRDEIGLDDYNEEMYNCI